MSWGFDQAQAAYDAETPEDRYLELYGGYRADLDDDDEDD